MTCTETSAARKRRDSAAAKYRPRRVKLLLVAEAPPCSLDRYFYFEDVWTGDWLFRYVCKGLFGAAPARADKAAALARLRDAGVFLIDLSEEPAGPGGLGREAKHLAPALVERCRKAAPMHIVLIKSNVYDAACGPLKDAGLPVVDARMPFPASGQQKKFEDAFGAALRSVGWSAPQLVP